MREKGIDLYCAEYVRDTNDFSFNWLTQNNCICNICHGTGAIIEFNYVTRDYESDKKKGMICKNLQTHHHSFWICKKCLNNFNEDKKIFLNTPKPYPDPGPCPYCKGKAVRKQLHFKLKEGEDRYKCEHHEDGSLKWTWLECDTCGRKTLAYCYEHTSTEVWNKGEAELPEKEKIDEIFE